VRLASDPNLEYNSKQNTVAKVCVPPAHITSDLVRLTLPQDYTAHAPLENLPGLLVTTRHPLPDTARRQAEGDEGSTAWQRTSQRYRGYDQGQVLFAHALPPKASPFDSQGSSTSTPSKPRPPPPANLQTPHPQGGPRAFGACPSRGRPPRWPPSAAVRAWHGALEAGMQGN